MVTNKISIRGITRNKYICESITKDGFKLPASESDVAKLIQREGNASLSSRLLKKKNLASELMILKEDVNDLLELTCTAEKMVQQVVNHLDSFGLIFQRDFLLDRRRMEQL